MTPENAEGVRPLKRRCAGCNRVITGRPNKLYCSDSCQWAAQKKRQRADNLSGVSGPIPSVIRGSNGVLGGPE